MKYEKSCGAVVFRQNEGQVEYLLIRHVNGGHWAFPKGHVEKGETEAQTALREIREETGLSVTLRADFRETVSYMPGPGITKEVVYFLALTEERSVSRQREEVSDCRWLPGPQALELATYDNDRRILQAAIRCLEG